MKQKSLRFAFLATAIFLLFSPFLNAQKGVLVRSHQLVSATNESPGAPYAPPRKGDPGSTAAKITTLTPIPLGSMGNAYSSLEPMNNCVYANDSTGVVVFIHRNNPAVNGGTSFELRYDISTDRGLTWSNDIGILNPTTASGRYPQVAGYYPSGSTAALSGRAIWATDHFDGLNWAGQSFGTSALVTTGSPSTYESLYTTSEQKPIGGMSQGLPGEYWMPRHTAAGGSQTDTLLIYKGVYNTGNQTIAWSQHDFKVLPWDLSLTGEPTGLSPSVAFSPNGSIGWIATLGDLATGQDSVLSPILLKSTDGGATWGNAVEIDLNSFAWVYDSLRALWIDSLGQPASSGKATAAFDYDLTVDANGNPHMFFVIGTAATGSPYSISSGLAKYAVDLTSSNQGNTFDLRLVAPVLAFRTMTFGTTASTITMDNYPQIARTHDGNHIFYTWVDSDTALWTGNMNGIGFGQSDNIAPNIWMAGLRVTDGYFTCIQPLTAMDLVWEGRALNPQMAPEVFVTGSGPTASYRLPIVMPEMPALEPIDPCNNYYLGNDAVITESLFAFAPGSTITWTGCGVNPGVAAHIRGKVFIDYNGNGVFDGTDVPIPNHTVTTTGITYADVTDANGDYSILCAPNLTYGLQVNAISSTVWSQLLPAAPYVLTPTAMANLTGNDFAYEPVTLTGDLAVTMSIPPMRPGFASGGDIYVTNHGTQPATGTLAWTHDSLVLLTGAIPAFASHNTTTHTATWNLPMISPFQTVVINVQTQLPVNVPLNTSLIFLAQVTTTGTDANPSNNFYDCNALVIGSYDPNDKASTPAGVGPSHQVMPGTPLNYRIRFQNTGTASAINVSVRDTLESDLDIATFKMLGSSHSNVLTIENGRILIWDFSNINLPDSFSNEPASHGHIDFSIAPKPNLPLGTVVDNSAAIYFDFNVPVITNISSITYDVPAGAAGASLQAPSIRIYPHPVEERTRIEIQHYNGKPWTFALYDLQGREVRSEQAIVTDRYEFERRGLPAGAYVYKAFVPGNLPKMGKMVLE